MRTLKFIVEGQLIRPDPKCDFSGLVPGTDGYLQAEFTFSKEWEKCAKVAAFTSAMGTEYPPQVLEDGKTCMVPVEACKRKMFYLRVFGKTPTLGLITTQKIEIHQDGGRA
jgi:hypothetical protein